MIEPLTELCRQLEYDFSDRELLRLALTHRSAGRQNNERLEYLGDAILGFVIGESLYQRFPDADEGQLSRLRASLVRKETLAELAGQLDLGPHLRLGEGEKKCGGWRRASTLADSLEAIIGAIYEDGGFEATRSFLHRLYKEALDAVSPSTAGKDPKTELQEFLQARRYALPSYEVVGLEGEPHAQTFTVRCKGPGIPHPIEARGTSRRRAEQAAACKALQLISSEA